VALVTVLASGGLDSTACLAYYGQQDHRVRALWVDYGQPAAADERRAVRAVARHYSTPLTRIRLSGVSWELQGEPAEFPGRNLTLVALAHNAHPDSHLIALGIHEGTPFADCSEEFAQQSDQVLNTISRGAARLDCPFLKWSKHDLALWAAETGVPYELVYSCERGSRPPCGDCAKCQESKLTRTLFSKR
jgi:7-cyano-7-deazaguanine synthase